MIGWILLGLVLLIAVLVFTLRLRLQAGYDETGGWVRLRLGPWRFPLYPVVPEKEERKQEKKAAKRAKKQGKSQEAPRKHTLGGTLKLLDELLPMIQEAAGKFHRTLQLDQVSLDLTWGEPDPADAAIHYGYAWAVAEQLLAFLEAHFVIKHRQVAIDLDYQLEQPRLCAQVGLSLTAAQLLWIALPAGAGGLKVLWTHRKRTPPAGRAAGQERKENHGE